MSRYGTLYHDAKQSLCPSNTPCSVFLWTAAFLPVRKAGRLSNGSVTGNLYWWTGVTVTPDRLLSGQHSHGCHTWLTHYLGFRNEMHLFHFGGLSGWSQKQFESFLHGCGSSCLNQAAQRSCCLRQLNSLLPCCYAAPQEQLRVAVLPCGLHCSLCSFHFLADTRGVVSPEGASGVSYKIVHRCKLQKSVSCHAGFN